MQSFGDPEPALADEHVVPVTDEPAECVAQSETGPAESVALLTNALEHGDGSQGPVVSLDGVTEHDEASNADENTSALEDNKVTTKYNPQQTQTESTTRENPLNSAENISLPEVNASKPPDLSVVHLIEKADHSAGKLVNLLAKHFPSFCDQARFDGRKVRFLKRAQIFVADLWAAFNGTSYGAFDDIAHLTMFAGEHCLNRDEASHASCIRVASGD